MSGKTSTEINNRPVIGILTLPLSNWLGDNIALDRATKLCNNFRDNNYTVILNRKRDKVMLELLFIRKDVYAG